MINEKELIKQIKRSGKDLVWSKQEGVNYISNRHWAVRYRVMPKPVLIALFSIFGMIPKNNKTLAVSFGEVEERENLNIKKIMEARGDLKPGTVTNVLTDYGFLGRVIKREGGIVIVNDDYIKITTDDNPLCKDVHGPLFFSNGDVVILPLRTVEIKHEEVIQELIV